MVDVSYGWARLLDAAVLVGVDAATTLEVVRDNVVDVVDRSYSRADEMDEAKKAELTVTSHSSFPVSSVGLAHYFFLSRPDVSLLPTDNRAHSTLLTMGLRGPSGPFTLSRHLLGATFNSLHSLRKSVDKITGGCRSHYDAQPCVIYEGAEVRRGSPSCPEVVFGEAMKRTPFSPPIFFLKLALPIG